MPSHSRGDQRGVLLYTLLAALLLPLTGSVRPVQAQTVDISGFVKSAYYYDTRQVVAAREGEFLLYPAADGEGADTDNVLFFPFFSRLRFAVGEVPEALGAEVTGLYEMDFFGPGNETLNTLRIRRLFVNLDWGNYAALFGMEWSPFFLQTWPQTVATEAGTPFQPFARYPQVRFTWKPGGYQIIGILAQQRDAFQEIGGLKQQQQAGIPAAMLHAELLREHATLGVGAYTKWIRPQLTSDRFNAGAVQAYATFTPPDFQFRAKVTYGSDLADHLMTGGYVTASDGDEMSYYPLELLAAWVDVQTTGTVGVGLFGGYLSNMGASGFEAGDQVVVGTSARGPDIDYIWRISPRLVYNVGRVRFAGEVQVTSALYASELDDNLAPDATDDDEAVTNVRGNLSVFLFF